MQQTTMKTGLNELTVTCRQCGSASMERLDRKEYRCTHCGAITVISDDDADRVESMLRSALNSPRPTPANPFGPDRIAQTRIAAVAIAVAIIVILLGLSLPSHSRNSNSHDTLTAQNTVSLAQVVLSPLQWKPDSDHDGTYTGLLYNHSGSTIDVPNYGMTVFLKGLKGGTANYDATVSNLQPGEYTPVRFRVISFQPHDRYEVEPPTQIDKSTEELVNLPLSQAQFVHQQGTYEYSLVGVVQNTYTRPVTGEAQLLLYDSNKQMIGSGHGYFSDVRPGDKSMLAMDVYVGTKDMPIAAYEYLIDAHYSH